MTTGFGKWVAACTAGELLGFGAAAGWALLAFTVFGFEPQSLGARVGVLGLMVLAGVFEGAVLGTLQWLALRDRLPRLPLRQWVGATIAVAALGWLVGMIPSTFGAQGSSGQPPPAEPAMWVILLGAAGFGALAGAAFGFAQWLVLRHHASNARRWIAANALGWALGLPWSYLAGSAGDLGKSVPLAVALGILCGALMGASVAVVTGLAVVSLRPRD